jgi:DNA-binding transcriptional MerR regulator
MTIRSTELIRMAGITYRQLDHWSRRGFIETKHPGNGRQRQWDEDETERTLMLARLVRAGFEPERASTYVTWLLRDGQVQLAPGVILAVTRDG